MAWEVGAAVAVGVFDGVHVGHQALLRQRVAESRRVGQESICVTFDPDPAEVLHPEEPHPSLTSLELRLARLRSLGIGRVDVVPFSEDFSTQSPEEFVDWMGQRFTIRSLWVGAGFALGRGRTGTTDRLQEIGKRRGFDVCVVEPIAHEGRTISSTWIRDLLAEGNVQLANDLLGSPYCLDGEVVSGARRGRELGFPTANVVPPAHRVVPGDGVFLVRARLLAEGEVGSDHGGTGAASTTSYYGVANLGGRPTFGETERLIETHLLDFSGDVYGARFEVCFLQQLRGVRKFSGVDELRAQIARDVAAARELIVGEEPRVER